MDEPTSHQATRTRLSKLVFYIVLVGLALCAVQSFRWIVEQYERTVLPFSQLSEASWIDWAALSAMLQSPALLTLILVALSLRNRAALWLIGGFVVISLPSAILGSLHLNMSILLTLGVYGLPLLGLVLILIYLLKTGEL